MRGQSHPKLGAHKAATLGRVRLSKSQKELFCFYCIVVACICWYSAEIAGFVRLDAPQTSREAWALPACGHKHLTPLHFLLSPSCSCACGGSYGASSSFPAIRTSPARGLMCAETKGSTPFHHKQNIIQTYIYHNHINKLHLTPGGPHL